MDTSGGITASLQGRYASALYELANEQKAVAAVEGDLARVGEALTTSPDLAALIRNPQVGRDAAARAMDGIGSLLALSPLTKNFLGVLAGNRRLGALPEIVRAFAAIAAAACGDSLRKPGHSPMVSAAIPSTCLPKATGRPSRRQNFTGSSPGSKSRSSNRQVSCDEAIRRRIRSG